MSAGEGGGTGSGTDGGKKAGKSGGKDDMTGGGASKRRPGSAGSAAQGAGAAGSGKNGAAGGGASGADGGGETGGAGGSSAGRLGSTDPIRPGVRSGSRLGRQGGRSGSGLNGRPSFVVLEGFAGRRSALPFALLLLAVLGSGLVTVLVLNTAIDRGAFQLQQSQQRQTDLTNQEQRLQQQVAGLSAPGALASEAAALGLVPNRQPAFLDPSGQAVLGSPSVAAAPPTTAAPTTVPPTTVAPTTGLPTTGAPATGLGANGVPGTGAASPGALAPQSATTVVPVPNGVRASAPLPPASPEPSGSAH